MKLIRDNGVSITEAVIFACLLISMPTILYAQEDTTPPELVELDFMPKTIDVTSSSQTVTFTARIIDDLSGFRMGSIHLRDPSGYAPFFGNASFSRISGDANDGVYEASVTFPQNSMIGTWKIERLVVADVTNPNRTYFETDLSGLGFPTEIEVASTQEDTTPPELVELDFMPKTIDVTSSSQTVTFTARIIDDLSGFRMGSIHLRDPSGYAPFFGNASFSRISGDANDGVYEASVTFPQNSMIGTWKIERLVVADVTNPNRTYFETDLSGLGFPTEIEVASTQEDTTPPELVELDFMPKTIDVTSSSQTVTFTARIIDDLSGFRMGSIHLRDPSGYAPFFGNASFSRISGDANDGVYEASVTFPQNSMIGTWKIERLVVADVTNPNRTYFETDLSGLGFPTEIEVASTQEDTTPPALLELDFTPKTIDVSSGPQTVTATLRVTDNLSGVRGVNVTFARPSGPPNIGTSTQILISGNEIDGVYECMATFPQFIEAGIWRIDFVTLSDAADNEIVLRESDLITMGFPTELEVASTQEDTTPPALLELDFTPKTIDVSSGPQTVTATLRVTDNLSGVRGVNVTFARPSGPPNIGTSTQILISGNEIDGVYECMATFPQFIEAGIWRIDFVTLSDAADNEIVLRESDLITMGFPTELEVASTQEDTTPPALLELDFTPKTIDVSSGPQTVTATLRVTDNLSGVRGVNVTFARPSGPPNIGTSTQILISGNEIDGVYECMATFPQFIEAGIWRIDFVTLSDAADNEIVLRESDLIANGFPTELTVTLASVYTLSGFEPPCDDIMTVKNKNRCVPLKTELFDADGLSITDADIMSPPVIDVKYDPGLNEPLDPTVFEGLPPAEATVGEEFEYKDGRWCYNFKIKDHHQGRGTYTVRMVSGDDSEYVINENSNEVIIVLER